MAFSRDVWNQIKNTTAEDLKKALERDGFTTEAKRGATLGFYKAATTPGGDPRRVVIHYHPKKTYGGKFLEGLINDAGWTEDDLRRLKLIK
jgi:predicted RNA binding protein YcfA (HicA-like mRNA interferase family)